MKENSIEENKNSNFSIEAKFESMIKMAREIINQNKENTGDCSIRTALAYDVAAYLSDYKRVLKENEELKDTNCLVKRYFKLKDTNTYLQKENEELKNQEATARKINELLVQRYSNSIPVQKVKDKIEEYKNMLKTCNKAKDIDRIKAINERILDLQELLEGRK